MYEKNHPGWLRREAYTSGVMGLLGLLSLSLVLFASPVFSADVLLVDDDNTPDVRFYYTSTLDALAVSYGIRDTSNTDIRPLPGDPES